MNWDDLRFLLAIARGTSLSDAARSLGVNQSTVSRRLAAMEARLGARLVERSAGGLALSPAGDDLVRAAERIETEVNAGQARLVGHDSRTAGMITVTCPDILLDRYLAPNVARFCAQFPRVGLRIVSSFGPVDLMRRDADIAIRISADPPETLVGRRAAGFAMAAYAARDYAAGLPKNPAPDRLDWIGWMPEDRNRAILTARYPDASIVHRTDGMIAMRVLVRAGLGASVLPCYWADHDPGLVRIFPDEPPGPDTGIWVLAHPDVARAARVRAFTGFTAGVIRADRDLFEGRRAKG